MINKYWDLSAAAAEGDLIAYGTRPIDPNAPVYC